MPAIAQEPVNQGDLSFSFGATTTSAYFFRGYKQEDSGLIFQPWSEVGVALVEGEGNSPGVSLAFGNWASLHSAKTGATEANVQAWYEADFYAGVTLDWDSFSLGLSHTVYTYPSSDFNTVQEIGLTAGYALPENTMYHTVLGDISLGLHFEVDNSNVSSDEVTYMELGFGPSFDILDEKATVSIPVTLGFSLDDYYVDAGGSDDFFGYASIGADLASPLGGGNYGEWTLNTGANLLLLGTAADEANGGDAVEFLAYIGLSVSY